MGIGDGVACVPVCDERPKPPPPQESAMADILTMRAPTPERRSTPGQVVKGGYRPKDQLGGGCVVADKPAADPMGLPRKVGSGNAGVGTGGCGHLVQGPCGFVPASGQEQEEHVESLPCAQRVVPFKPVWSA